MPGEEAQTRSAARPDWAALALLLLALIAAAPLWAGPGLVNTRAGGDSPFLFIRLHQLVENLRAGVFPVRWMPDAAYGLGYPFFNFYAALPYYFAAVFNLIGFDLLASIKIVQTLGFVLAAWAMYGWARSALSAAGAASHNTAGWLAAAAYTVAPFHLVNTYVRGDSLSEFYAFVFYPLILRAVDRVVNQPGRRSIAWLGLAYGGLILTHNVSALIFSPFVAMYIVVRSWRWEVGGWRSAIRRSAFSILHSVLGVFLGLLVSAWFWLPALGEAPLVQLDAQTTGYFNYSQHFRSDDLIQASLLFDYGSDPPRTSFAMGLAQALATLAGVAIMLASWRRGSTRLRWFTLIGLIVSTLMITPLSKPVWDALPLLPLAQFPWRFLSVQAVFASLAISYCVARVPSTQHATRNTQWLSGLLGLALTASTLLSLHPDYLPIRADEITPERIQLYEAFTTNIGTTIRAEYLPRTMMPRPYTGAALIDPAAPPRAIPVRGEADAECITRQPTSQTWIVRAASDSTLAFPITYFPGWRATIDDQPAETRAAIDLGYVEVDVPAGEHTIRLWLDRTPIRAVAEIASLAALLMVIGLLATARRRTEDKGRKRAPLVARLSSFVSSHRYEAAILGVACILAALASAAGAVEARDDDLTMDFESRPWRHHPAESESIRRYEYSALTPGSPFNVSFEWLGPDAPGQAVTVQLVAPSQHAFGGPETIAASEAAPLLTGANRHTLQVPASLSKGMVYVMIEGQGVEGPPARVFLKPIFFAGSPDGNTTWARIAGQIELKAVALKHDQPDRLTVAFDWAALKPITANYAVSLRLQDASGRVWVSLDTQPGYGFLPTSAWPTGEVQHDVYTLALPPDMPRDGAYALDVVWYRAAAQAEIGRVRVPGISIASAYNETSVSPPPHNFGQPAIQHPVDATFGAAIRLLGYDATQNGRRLTLTLHWQALADIGADYKFFVHVFDPATEAIAAQADAMPGQNAYPTSRWVKGEVVSESFEFELADGTYRIATGWIDPNTRDRLPAFDAQGNRLAADRMILVQQVSAP